MPDPKPARSNLVLRILTAAFFVPLIFYLLYVAPSWGFPLFAGLICAVAAHEVFAMVTPGDPLMRLWGVLSTVCVFCVVGLTYDARLMLTMTVILVCGGMTIAFVRTQDNEGASERMAWALAGPLYVGSLFGITALLFRRPDGGSWVLLAMTFGFLSDTFGYFIGRAIGRRQLHPISPKKTVEGAVGGLAGGLTGGLLAHFYFLPALPLLDAILLSVVATTAGQVGDLCESLIKRATQTKDSGSFLPGHGGVLDRADAMIFSVAIVWIYVEWFF